MHLFTTEDAEDTEVNFAHAGTEMNESFFIFHKPEKYKTFAICNISVIPRFSLWKEIQSNPKLME